MNPAHHLAGLRRSEENSYFSVSKGDGGERIIGTGSSAATPRAAGASGSARGLPMIKLRSDCARAPSSARAIPIDVAPAGRRAAGGAAASGGRLRARVERRGHAGGGRRPHADCLVRGRTGRADAHGPGPGDRPRRDVRRAQRDRRLLRAVPVHRTRQAEHLDRRRRRAGRPRHAGGHVPSAGSAVRRRASAGRSRKVDNGQPEVARHRAGPAGGRRLPRRPRR